jgi:hypothetical protein
MAETSTRTRTIEEDCGQRETNPDEDEVFSPSDLQNRFRSSIVLELVLLLGIFHCLPKAAFVRDLNPIS